MRGSLFNAILTELLGLLCPSDFAEHTALLCASSIRAILACHQSCPGFFSNCDAYEQRRWPEKFTFLEGSRFNQKK
jgi:hypothetical protein